MDRWACVSVAALPLQLVLRQNPQWRALPTVVVDEDRPQGKVLWANAEALTKGVLPGHSYTLALSLVAGLRASEVSALEIRTATRQIQELLWLFSPAIEVGDEHGVFWLDASGLRRLFVSLEAWAAALRQKLMKLGFDASVVVGFSRFGTYALARSCSEQQVFDSEASERERVAQLPLARLGIDPEFRDVLAKLGVHTIAALLHLPANGLLTRFGKDAQRLHALAAGAFSPLEPVTWVAPLQERALLDDAESDTTRLLFVIKRMLDALLTKLVLRGEALASITLTFQLDRKLGRLTTDALRAAVPTLDGVQWADLVRLHLGSLCLEAGVVEITLDGRGVPTSAEQLQAFAEQPRRDLAAARRAIARLRAEYGEGAVTRAVLSDGHLPEACFTWQPVEDVRLPVAPSRVETPAPVRMTPTTKDVCTLAQSESVVEVLSRRPLVRRIFKRPEVLSAPARQLRDDGWLIRGALHGPVTNSSEPYVVLGGWWLREVHREYSFVLTRRGELLWVYQDKRRRRWLLHGEVQ